MDAFSPTCFFQTRFDQHADDTLLALPGVSWQLTACHASSRLQVGWEDKEEELPRPPPELMHTQAPPGFEAAISPSSGRVSGLAPSLQPLHM